MDEMYCKSGRAHRQRTSSQAVACFPGGGKLPTVCGRDRGIGSMSTACDLDCVGFVKSKIRPSFRKSDLTDVAVHRRPKGNHTLKTTERGRPSSGTRRRETSFARGETEIL